MRQILTRTLILSGAALAVAAPAIAATPFSGPYVGAQAGWQQERLSVRASDGTTTDSASGNNSGFSYGAYAGYDYNINGKGIVGVEGALSGSTNKFASDEEDAELNSGRTFEIVGRAGALISSNTLVYGRAGYANARYTVPADIGNLSFTKGGWIVGVGIDHAFTDTISARVEYNYSKFGSQNFAFDDGESAFDASIRPSRNAVRAGVSFHF